MPEAKKLNRRRAGRFSLLFTIYNLCNLCGNRLWGATENTRRMVGKPNLQD